MSGRDSFEDREIGESLLKFDFAGGGESVAGALRRLEKSYGFFRNRFKKSVGRGTLLGIRRQMNFFEQFE